MLVSSFECDGETLSTLSLGDEGGESRGVVVFLHGAGQSNKTRLRPVMTELAKSFRVLSFDFSGHGESTGRLDELSLERRSRQAVAFCAGLKVTLLVGTSMSGQTVCDVLSVVEPDAVALFNPAAYAPEAWSVPFGSGFTEIIRQPESWLRSNAYAELDAFVGTKFLATSEFDEVIPPGVTDLFSQCGVHDHVLDGATHQVTAWLEANPAMTEELARLMVGQVTERR